MAQETAPGNVQGFTAHLIELRNRLIRSAVAIIAVFLCLMPFAAEIFDLLATPMMSALPPGSKLIATGVVAPFMVPVKITLLAAFVITLPYVLHQAWAFLAPGLYAHEKRLVLPLIVASSLLFVAGIAFCHYFVFGVVFAFIQQFAPQSVSVAPDIESYFGFVMMMFLSFGVTFEVPVVVILLVRVGIVSVERLRQARPYVIVGAFVVAAVITPPDVMSQLLLAIPLCLLYELGLLLAPWFGKRK